jgi:S1-C subfamily serine protease
MSRPPIISLHLRRGRSAEADIESGDIITAVNGTKVKDARELARTIGVTPPSDVPHLGLSLAAASDVTGAGDKGVVVMSVEPDVPAAEQGFERGNVILDVAGKPVANVGDVRNAQRGQDPRQARCSDAGADGTRPGSWPCRSVLREDVIAPRP